MSLRIAVFASGSGSNLQALMERFPAGGAAEVALVIADRVDAGALERARERGVATRVIGVRGRGHDEVAGETLETLGAAEIGLVCLAGYNKRIPPEVVASYRSRMLNIHPALLPAFGGQGMWGRNVHEAVLRAGCTVSGPTVHLVDEEYDTGRIIAQWPVPVLRGDTAELLARRVLRVEHRLYPAAVAAVAAAIARHGAGWADHPLPDWTELPHAVEDPGATQAIGDPMFEWVQGS